MSATDSNAKNNSNYRNTFSGAIIGVGLVSFATIFQAYLFSPYQLQGSEYWLLFLFKAPDGILLGATSGASIGWCANHDYKRASSNCILLGSAIFAYWSFVAYQHGGDIMPLLMWSGLSLLWSTALIIWGFKLRLYHPSVKE